MGRPQHRARNGQSAIEFLFIVMFFMMLVGFIRTFVYFELDVFNNTNKARYQTLRYIRSGGFGQEDTKNRQDLNQSFQDINTSRLRPIPFIKYRFPATSPQYRLSTRKLQWQAGTKGEDCKAMLGCSTITYVIMTGATATP
jgi:hypothetical protein